jgi:hypothetical protein
VAHASPYLEDDGSWCPDSEVRIIVRHFRLRTSESKDTSNSLIECGFGSEVRISDSPQEWCGLLNRHTRAPIPKFASLCGTLVCELRNRRTLAAH